MSALANIDTTKVIGRSGCPQVTMREKVAATSDLKTLVYESIPNTVTWGQVARIAIPGGGVMQRADFWPLWKRVMIRFDCGMGVSPGPGRSIRACALGILHAIESITITFDQQTVTISGGS